jgi:hypothetical protein
MASTVTAWGKYATIFKKLILPGACINVVK